VFAERLVSHSFEDKTDRKGRAVCASHARALRIRWFDDAVDH
jgi:hypothetical protein